MPLDNRPQKPCPFNCAAPVLFDNDRWHIVDDKEGGFRLVMSCQTNHRPEDDIFEEIEEYD